jgi:hypothetical protein
LNLACLITQAVEEVVACNYIVDRGLFSL